METEVFIKKMIADSLKYIVETINPVYELQHS